MDEKMTEEVINGDTKTIPYEYSIKVAGRFTLLDVGKLYTHLIGHGVPGDADISIWINHQESETNVTATWKREVSW